MPQPLYPWGRAPVIYYIGGWMGMVVKRKIPAPTGNQNLVVQSVV